MNLKKFVYGLYKKTNNSKIICTAAFFLYSMLSGFKNKNCRVSNKKGERKYIKDIKTPVLKKDVKVAFICDDMTYKCFSQECDARFVTPNNWHNIFDEFMPDIFFCESEARFIKIIMSFLKQEKSFLVYWIIVKGIILKPYFGIRKTQRILAMINMILLTQL